MDLTLFSAVELAEKIRNREVSSKEVVEAYFDKIEKNERKLNIFITLNKEEAVNMAEEIDEKISKGEKVGSLAGVPIAIKDNIVTKDLKTTCGSKMLEDFIPPYDATVIEKIKEEGGIIVGKTNMDEFSIGSSTETSHFGPTKNPYDLNKVPGGSDGGSAVSVATREVPISLGSDTGGSIRQPASFNSVVGFKPSYGLISRYGLIPCAPSLDQVGIFSGNVKDCAFLLNVLADYDQKDSTSVKKEEIDYVEILKDEDIRGLRIGLPKEFFGKTLDSRIKEKVDAAIKTMEELGAKVEEVSLPHMDYALATYIILMNSEASSSLSRFDGVRFGYRTENYSTIDELYINSRSEGFGKETKRSIVLGTYNLSSKNYKMYYEKAQKVRTLIKDDFERAFKEYDLILTPTTPNLPFDIGENENSPLNMYKNYQFTAATNLAGMPAISVPCGYVEGLPVGLQFIGDRFRDDIVLKGAYMYEKNRGIDFILPSLRSEEDGI